ncbi:hypothetical protein [Pseudomonas sp. PDM20]|uniref:hypothetical protein n=1 Tax=Pseudomonas sp. PDM20 TaxID=2769254 RepID=UPI001786ABA6|nr:hypothetical protein [Pseudomonas sp. PDM20]MBD9681899.1 hypothetical protein [Pseudomonas sp. PDM20]
MSQYDSDDARLNKSRGRRATAFSILSAFSLLMAAAFAEPMQVKLGIPSLGTYILAGIGAALTLLLNLGTDHESLSHNILKKLAIAYTVTLVLLNAALSYFAIVDAGGINQTAMVSIGLFLLIMIAALLCLKWLMKLVGNTQTS